MSSTATIQWGAFSDKHINYIKSGISVRMSVAEGAIRSGKTVDNCIIAAAVIDESPDRIHLVSGSTVANAKLNVGDCNGYGLEHLFRGRCKWGKYKHNEALIIEDCKGSEKVVIFSGGAKADSYKSILGNSYGLWLATEVNEHFDSDNSRESFIKVAFGRQVAAKRPVTLWDLNPCYPEHKIYTDYIDKYAVEGLPGGYQHKTFTIHDNLNISKENMANTIAMYNEDSVWFRRDILGMRERAEGLIYQQFADNQEIYKASRQELDYDYINIGMDIGGNKSYHTIVATGLKHNASKITALKSARIRATGTTPADIDREYKLFYDEVQRIYGNIKTVYFESAEQILKNHLIANNRGHNIRNSIKHEIMNRVRTGVGLMDVKNRRFYYTEHCDSLVAALRGAVYNPKKLEDERLDNGTSDIDTLDAWEYSWEEQLKKLSRFERGR